MASPGLDPEPKLAPLLLGSWQSASDPCGEQEAAGSGFADTGA